MAKGKQAARAANRRLEAAYAHIDRLTDELAEAKLRAKQCEKDATRLPVVLAELEQEREYNRTNTSGQLERERTKLRERETELLKKMTRAAELARKFWDRLGEEGKGITLDESVELNELVPLSELNPELFGSRNQRRNGAKGPNRLRRQLADARRMEQA